jgi:polyisoprenoid-binding protein YceI
LFNLFMLQIIIVELTKLNFLKMKQIKLLIASLALLSQGMLAQVPTTVWNLDKAHSSIGFSVDHMVISEVYGNFLDFSTDVKSDKPDFTDVVVDFTIQAKSIDTKETKRDAHLRSADFFDVDKYPTITFKGKKFEKVTGNQYKLTGDLTMHGVTKSVVFNAKFGVIKDPYGNTRAGISINGELDRFEYGLKWSSTVEAGGLVVGKTVKLMCNVELVKAK